MEEEREVKGFINTDEEEEEVEEKVKGFIDPEEEEEEVEEEDVEECIEDYVYLYKDGRVVRTEDAELLQAEAEGTEKEEEGVKYRDVIINRHLNVWARIYLPLSDQRKKGVIVSYPGGAFCMFSPRSEHIHTRMLRWASRLNTIVVSVKYRLAPEHRLPAAYEDAQTALKWLIYDGDEWIRRYADMSRVFLMGESSGANIAHHVGTRKDSSAAYGVKGVILLYPLFLGEKATLREEKLRLDGCAPIHSLDIIWRLALPVGADRDHPFCNPLIDGGGGDVDEGGDDVKFPALLLIVAGNSSLRDRQMEYGEAMKRKKGICVEVVEFHGEDHGFGTHGFHDESFVALLSHVQLFITRTK